MAADRQRFSLRDLSLRGEEALAVDHPQRGERRARVGEKRQLWLDRENLRRAEGERSLFGETTDRPIRPTPRLSGRLEGCRDRERGEGRTLGELWPPSERSEHQPTRARELLLVRGYSGERWGFTIERRGHLLAL